MFIELDFDTLLGNPHILMQTVDDWEVHLEALVRLHAAEGISSTPVWDLKETKFFFPVKTQIPDNRAFQWLKTGSTDLLSVQPDFIMTTILTTGRGDFRETDETTFRDAYTRGDFKGPGAENYKRFFDERDILAGRDPGATGGGGSGGEDTKKEER
jgi:hypothetical protein